MIALKPATEEVQVVFTFDAAKEQAFDVFSLQSELDQLEAENTELLEAFKDSEPGRKVEANKKRIKELKTDLEARRRRLVGDLVR